MTDKYQGHYMTATQLLLLVNQSAPGNYPVVRVMPENRKHFADFTDAIEHFDYIDNQMLAFVTSAKEKDGCIEFSFDAAPFELHNKEFERAQFYARDNNDKMLTSREKYEEKGKQFSMEDSAGFGEDESFFILLEHKNFLDKASAEEIETLNQEVKEFVANLKNTSDISEMVTIGYLAAKIHAKEATETEKRILRTLLDD